MRNLVVVYGILLFVVAMATASCGHDEPGMVRGCLANGDQTIQCN